jgi:hypothetical protein
MLVLAGATQTRTWSRPVPVADIARAALSEVEDYPRIDLYHLEDAAVAGRAVADLMHLIAELLENATPFSPPEVRVTVIGQNITDGRYRLRIVDQGIGMTSRELGHMSWLAQAPGPRQPRSEVDWHPHGVVHAQYRNQPPRAAVDGRAGGPATPQCR